MPQQGGKTEQPRNRVQMYVIVSAYSSIDVPLGRLSQMAISISRTPPTMAMVAIHP
jgi:hypothetical protein